MTIIDFAPSTTSPFQFQATLDGDAYNCYVVWSLFRRNYVLSVYSQDGTLIVSIPFVGSPLGSDISLVAGYFTSTLVYRIQNGQIEVAP